jgi:Flp pilus assembly protein TadG
MQVMTRLKEWASQPSKQKRAVRYQKSGTVAYYWDGSVPVPREIRDISLTGAFLRTQERWYPGTIVTLMLITNRAGAVAPTESIEVRCRVVRHGADGVGLQFISQQMEERRSLRGFLVRVIASLRRNKIVDARPSTKGQSLVEFALMVPFLFLLIVLVVNFGGFLYAWIAVANAARAGAQYAILGGASVGLPATATGPQINTLVTNDVYSLLGGTSPTVNVCKNDATVAPAVVTVLQGSCSSLPSDPEASSYVLYTVDVTYSYTPFIRVFNFSQLGIHMVPFLSSPISIHRRAVMRME